MRAKVSLRLVQRPNSDRWYIRGTASGKDVFTSTGSSDRGIAEAILAKETARLLDEQIYGAKAVTTFDQAAKSFIAGGGSSRFILEKRADNTTRGIWHEFAGRLLTSINQTELDAIAARLYPLATVETRNRQLYAPFIAIWNHAVANGWAEPRKWKRPRKVKGTNVRRLKPMRSGTRPVDYERAFLFVSALSPAPAMVMTALFYSGMRPIELFGLMAEDVDVDRRWIVLQTTKTGEPRGVPMHEFVLPLYAGLVARGGRLFRTPRNEPYPLLEGSGGQLKTAINGARRRTGIKDISPYTGRHSVSTQLVVNGVHPHIKDQILGHAVDDMSRHYTHVPQAPLIDAINTLPTWPALEWMENPAAWQRRLVAGTGKRNDLLIRENG